MVKRKTTRILALIWSGILVLIIFPFGALILSLYIDSILNLSLFIPSLLRIFSAIISFINGFFWAIWSNLELYHLGEGSPIPLKNTQTVFLVAGGPYKYSRNPMVFGYIFIWIGLGLLFNSVFLLLGFSVIITILLILFVKLWEEKNLEKRFGQNYKAYLHKTSFLIPLPEKKKQELR